MFIEQLTLYAEHKELGVPGYAPKAAKFALVCNTPSGQTPLEDDFSIISLGDCNDKKNPGIVFPLCPETPNMNSGGKSHLLLETIEVVLGVTKSMLLPGEEKKKKDIDLEEKIIKKHEFFVNSLEIMADVLPEATLFVPLLKNQEYCLSLLKKLEEAKGKTTDKITLRAISNLSGDSFFLVDDIRWHSWWNSYRNMISGKDEGEDDGKADSVDTANSADSANSTNEPVKERARESKRGKSSKKEVSDTRMISLVTGKLVDPIEKHPQITELADVGASSMGASFISFYIDSLTSYGLKSSTNAAMDEESASSYRAAINDIFKSRTGTNKRFGNVKFGYWYSSEVPDDCNPLDMIEGLDEKQEKDLNDLNAREALNKARQMLDAWKSGIKVKPTALYYSLALSGNAGRVIIRDWAMGSLIQWVEAVDKWFSDTSIVKRDGSGIMNSHKFNAVIGSLFREIKDTNDVSSLIVAIWKAAMNSNVKIPEVAVNLALRRIRIEIGNNDKSYVPNHARMGLLRAYLIRNIGDKNMKPVLNEEHPDVAYQCGRLMSLLADLQYKALGEVNAGIVQRFYSAASMTPLLVLGRLMRMSQFYISKLEKPMFMERNIANVWGCIRDDIPATFSLKQQTLFAQGYYQQEAYTRWMQDEYNKQAKAEKE